MAQFTMKVKSSVIKTDYPTVTNEQNTNCHQSVDVNVKVPAGQTRHITITGIGTASGSQNLTEVISADKTYTLILDAHIDQGNPSNNTNYSTVTINVKLSSSDQMFWTKQINRTHTPNIC